MDQDTSPYNVHELARAKATLTFEMNKDSFKFLHQRMSSFVKTHSKFSENLWEGPEGRMEHIKSGFPMPKRIEEKAEPINFSPTLLTTGNLIEEPQRNDATLIPCQGKGSSSPFHSQFAQEEQLKILPSSSHSPEIKSEKAFNDIAIHSHSDNAQSSPGSSNLQSNSAKQCSDVHQTSSNLDLMSASKAEQKHWVKLANIQRKIQFALKDMEAIRPLFKKSNHDKASKEMETLHWTIQGLITSLTEEKKSGDKNKFRLVLKQKPAEQNESDLTKVCPQSYKSTWLSLKRLCSKFKNMWRLNESVLSQFNSLEEISKAKLQSRLKKIAVTHSKNPSSL